MRKTAAVALLACAVVVRAATYTTYIGDVNQYQVSAIATDGSGNTYITGGRMVGPGVPATSYAPVTDVFFAKLDLSGNLTLIGTFSGKGTDVANGIAVDTSGNIYVVGNTTSQDFPLHNPLQSVSFTTGAGAGLMGGTGFLMKLSPDGAIVYSTYLGGARAGSSLNAVAADAQGNAYVAGTTQASDYPRTAGLPAGTVSSSESGISGAFFAKVDPAGSHILYAGALAASQPACGSGSTCFFGGQVATGGTAIAVDAAGNAYIAGNTNANGLQGTPGALLADGIGAFVAKVNSAGSGLVYLTYLGSASYINDPTVTPGDTVLAIAADADGSAYISGATSDPAFPATAGALQTSLASSETDPSMGPPSNAFVAKLNPSGSAMVWATFLGGTGPDQAHTIATDSVGDVWVSGTTQSSNFPAKVSVTTGGNEFLAELNSSGSALSYSALFPSDTVAAALAVDSSGTVHVAGANGLVSAFSLDSEPGVTSAPWMFGIANSAGGVLAGRLVPGELISIYGMHLGPAAPLTATFDAEGFLPTTLGGVHVAIDGVPAPLLYVSGAQINAVAPVELKAGTSVELQISQNGAPLPDFRVQVDIAAPQVFLHPDGSGAAINQDGTVNSKANPAPVGSYVAVWATGTGFFPGSDGQMATGALQFCAAAMSYCSMFQPDGIPGSATSVVVWYTGAAPGTVNGVVQIDFQVTSTAYGYYLSVNGVNSDVFGIYTTP